MGALSCVLWHKRAGVVVLMINALIPVLFAGNWDSIKTEISSSNVLQRDSVMFAKKLGSNMEQYARDKEEEVRLLTSCENLFWWLLGWSLLTLFFGRV